MIVITGCMGSGKTEEMIRLLNRERYAKKKVAVFKALVDVRSKDKITSRNGSEFDATEIEDPRKIVQQIVGCDVVAVDEVQFFGTDLIDVINSIINSGKHVFAGGLDTDFRGEPFGIVPHLISVSDTHIHLNAICIQCGSVAVRTQRLIDGQPAPYGSPIIQVGGDESYEARCRECHSVPK